ncbi:MAG: protein kinase [Candidatus Hydrogenedentes bacterium]|nr:protein kinase [Candidatus Hydrogenedentota bacterium]
MSEQDTSLLFGVFAVQFKKITPQQLHEVAALWQKEPSRQLSRMLVEAGYLSEDDYNFVCGLVEDARRAHKGDAAAALQTFGGQRTIDETYRGSVTLSHDQINTVPMPEGAIPGIPLDTVEAVDETPGRYTNQSEYARGGIGRVLLVHDQHLGREIAMKELLPFTDYADESMRLEKSPVRQSMDLVVRFLQEARVTGQLEHPAIVPVYELGRRRDGTLYYTMKLVRGRTLGAAIREAGTLPDRLALLSHFVDLCQAIAYSHSRRVIHRDIKPSNVMVGRFGETVVLDWGLAKVKDKKDEAAAQIEETLKTLRLPPAAKGHETHAGQVLGTPTYMPPEQAAGQIDRIDERSDIYSLGAVLYTLLTGKYPYDGENVSEILNRVLVGPPKPVLEVEPNAPPELAAICERAMQREADKRYKNAKDLADEVVRFQTGALVLAHSYKFSDHLKRFVQRHKPALATAALFTIALAAFAVYSYVRVTHERNDAIVARNDEAEQRKIAEEAKVAETEQRNKAESRLYSSQIGLAQSQIDARRFDLAQNALDSAPEGFRGWEWHYLNGLCNQDVFTFAKHKRTVSKLEVSPDGTLIASGDEGGVVCITSASTGELIREFPPLDGAVSALDFDSKGTRLLAANRGGEMRTPDGSVIVWDVATGQQTVTITAQGGTLWDPRFSPDDKLIASSVTSLGVQLWNAADGALLHTFKCVPANEGGLAFHPSGKQLAACVGTDKFEVKVWDVLLRGEVASLEAQPDPNTQLRYSPDGRSLLSWRSTGGIVLWNESYVQPARQLLPPDVKVLSLQFSNDSSRMCAGLKDGSAQILDVATGNVLTTLSGHTKAIDDIQFSSDNLLVATGSGDGAIGLWDAVAGKQLHVYVGHSAEASKIRFTKNDALLISCSSDTTVKAWQVKQVPVPQKIVLRGHTGGISRIAFSPDGERVLTVGQARPPYEEDNTVRIWNCRNGVQLHELVSANLMIHGATWSPDGNYIVTNASKSVVVWDANTGQQRHELAGHKGPVHKALFSPDGKTILTVSGDKTAILWRVSDGSIIHTLAGHLARVEGGAFSPNGKLIATNSVDRSIRVWDTETGNAVAVLQGHQAPINAVMFMNDGNRLISAAGDDTLILWDVGEGKAIRVFHGHSGIVFDAAINVDERVLVSVATDATLRLWDIESGNQIAQGDGHSLDVLSVAFSPDGSRIVSTGDDRTVRIWDAKDAREVAVFREHSDVVTDAVFSPDGSTIATCGEDGIAILHKLPK